MNYTAADAKWDQRVSPYDYREGERTLVPSPVPGDDIYFADGRFARVFEAVWAASVADTADEFVHRANSQPGPIRRALYAARFQKA